MARVPEVRDEYINHHVLKSRDSNYRSDPNSRILTCEAESLLHELFNGNGFPAKSGKQSVVWVHRRLNWGSTL